MDKYSEYTKKEEELRETIQRELVTLNEEDCAFILNALAFLWKK